jgi:hypothetical protein
MRNKQAEQPSPYEVGYGRPPRDFRFKKGRSGNPKGTKRTPALAADLRVLLERALSTKVRDGDHETIVTRAAAGIEQLVTQFAKGDRHARRDLIALAEKLGVDLTGQPGALENAVTSALAAEDGAIIADFLRRHGVEPKQGGVTLDLNSDQSDADNPMTSEEDQP